MIKGIKVLKPTHFQTTHKQAEYFKVLDEQAKIYWYVHTI